MEKFLFSYLVAHKSREQARIRNNDWNPIVSIVAIVGNVMTPEMMLKKHLDLNGLQTNVARYFFVVVARFERERECVCMQTTK